MDNKKNRNSVDRREFIKIVATAAFSGPVLWSNACSRTNESTETQETIRRNEQPTMTYRKLGRTGFSSSRLVFGCGAALMGGRSARLLKRAFEAGINHYDWSTKSLAQDTAPLVELQGLLKRAGKAGIGLIGMKAVRYLAPYWSMGQGDPGAFDNIYGEKLKASPFSPFQRAYAYVLQYGLDVVNADMRNFKHLEENIIAAATADRYFS
jgi:hypothetical protein